MEPLVSIVMPVYNAEVFLSDTLNSIKRQTYQNYEVICVDDGSTDNTLDILKKYAESDQRIHFIQQRNQYAGVARNNGMKIAQGKYLMFLDADDLFEKKMLSALVSVAERNNTDVVFFGFYHFKNDIRHRSLMKIPFSSRKVCSPLEHKTDIFRIAQGVPWNKFYNREFVVKSGLQFQGLQSNNDVFFSKMIVVEAERLLFLNKRLVNYRISNGDSLQGSYKLASGNFAKCILLIYKELNSRGKYQLYKESFENYVVDTYMLTFNMCKDIKSFEIVCEFMRKSFKEMHMTVDSKAISTHTGHKVFENIIGNRYKEALFELNLYIKQQYVKKNTAEYRIGKKLLSMFKIKNYD